MKKEPTHYNHGKMHQHNDVSIRIVKYPLYINAIICERRGKYFVRCYHNMSQSCYCEIFTWHFSESFTCNIIHLHFSVCIMPILVQQNKRKLLFKRLFNP